VVYGSLATTIIGLLSHEIARIILLLGAQVIAEYQRFQDGDAAALEKLQTDATRAECSDRRKLGRVSFRPQ
jgi:membrane protein